MCVKSVPMIFTLIAIICVAIAGTVGADPTMNTSSQRPAAAQIKFIDDYKCSPEFETQFNSDISHKVKQCVGKKWVLTDKPSDAINTDRICCQDYDTFIIHKALLDRKCSRAVAEPKYKTVVTDTCKRPDFGQIVSLCSTLTGAQPMGEDCDHFIHSLNAGVDTRRTSTPVLVLLAAIVVSIAGDVYGF